VSHSIAGRIGPNAITRMAEALTEALGPEPTTTLFDAAGLAAYRATPPERMVDEVEVIRLHQVVRAALDAGDARRVAIDAGRRTGDYLLGNRIPRPVQLFLRPLPPGLAARVLVAAIGRHAWTFAGSGSFAAHPGRPLVLSIAGCALCRGAVAAEPLCDYYAATFERLFRALVSDRSRVRETACQAQGAPACRFEIAW
jgi:divinyl protochlorophyllide a 8-vinyl-reductase